MAKPRSAYQKPGRPRPAQPTAAERMERKRKAKEQPKVDYYLASKAKALSYDYAGIPEEHRELVQRAALDIRTRQKRAAEDLIAIGRQLLQIKDLLSHGQFRAWWRAEFDYSERMVQGMMRVALIYGDPANARRVAHLSDGALYLLAAPSTPDTVRWEVAERMEMLDFHPTRAQIKAIIDAHKPPKQLGSPLGAPPMPQLIGPVAEPDAIDAEYTVVPEPPSFAEWLAAMPTDLSLREQLAILALAKTTALRALGDHPQLYNAVYGALPTWSHLIHEIEKRLKTDE